MLGVAAQYGVGLCEDVMQTEAQTHRKIHPEVDPILSILVLHHVFAFWLIMVFAFVFVFEFCLVWPSLCVRLLVCLALLKNMQSMQQDGQLCCSLWP